MSNNSIYVTKALMPTYEEYITAIKPLWDTHIITNMGAYHMELEKRLAEYLDVSEISLTVNGHMALELTIQSFGFPENSEIITPPFTFISTTHAIVRNKMQPVFCDVKEVDGTIDENKIESLITEKTVAILPVHVYGNICNAEAIERIAEKYNLKVIYDAAHAFGEEYEGRSIATCGDVSIFSFHATKVFNTIEGGAVVCKNHELYNKIKDLKNFGIRNEELVASVGANAKMNEFCAAMGLCNLKRVDDSISYRKQVYDYYIKEIENIKGLSVLLPNIKGLKRNFAYFPLVVGDEYGISRNELYDKLSEKEIHARKYFYPITADQACFKNKYINVKLETARKLSDKILCLPIYDGLEEEYQKKIIDILKGCYNE